MALVLDHLVIVARTLDEGARWVAERLGATPAGGGKHVAMGTHNRLLSLGPDCYLEVMAVDPESPPPPRPRWFALDEAASLARIARGPALVHWAVRSDDIERDLARFPGPRPEVLAMQRGDFRWRIAVPRDGTLADDGTRPTLIQWEGPRPTSVLPDAGVRLARLRLRHASAANTLRALADAGLTAQAEVEATADGPALRALFQTPRGPAWLPGIVLASA